MVDYIKREDVLSYLPQYPLDYSFEQTQAFMKGFIQLRKYIVSCPTADVVERKHGKWKRNYDGIFYWWECSECHHDAWYDREDLTNFCPNCGAQMESADDV